MKILVLRSCDSHTLNTSPFCDMSKRLDPNGWAADVIDLYGDSATKPSYLPDMDTARRLMYPTKAIQDKEILKSLTKKVTILNLSYVGGFDQRQRQRRT